MTRFCLAFVAATKTDRSCRRCAPRNKSRLSRHLAANLTGGSPLFCAYFTCTAGDLNSREWSGSRLSQTGPIRIAMTRFCLAFVAATKTDRSCRRCAPRNKSRLSRHLAANLTGGSPLFCAYYTCTAGDLNSREWSGSRLSQTGPIRIAMTRFCLAFVAATKTDRSCRRCAPRNKSRLSRHLAANLTGGSPLFCAYYTCTAGDLNSREWSGSRLS
jgi:hypothetical protein